MSEWLVGLIVLAQVLDAWSTHYALKRGFVEKNRLLVWLFENNPMGSKAIWVVKIPFVIALIAFYPMIPTWALVLILGLYIAVLGNNFRHLYLARSK